MNPHPCPSFWATAPWWNRATPQRRFGGRGFFSEMWSYCWTRAINAFWQVDSYRIHTLAPQKSFRSFSTSKIPPNCIYSCMNLSAYTPRKLTNVPKKRGTISCREYIWTNPGIFRGQAVSFQLRCRYSGAVWLGYQLWIHSNGLCHHWSCQRYGCSEESFVPWQWFRNHGKSILVDPLRVGDFFSNTMETQTFCRGSWFFRNIFDHLWILDMGHGCFQK